jgi:hypothetical protein
MNSVSTAQETRWFPVVIVWDCCGLGEKSLFAVTVIATLV